MSVRAPAAQPPFVAAALASLGVASLCWVVSLQRMSGMDMGPATDLGSFAFFLGLWVPMMAAMMLPSAAPTLWRYRSAVGRTGRWRHAGLTALAAGAYLCVWAVFGLSAFPLGVALAACERVLPAFARAVPVATGVVVVVAGAIQFSSWKAHHLACWRTASGDSERPPARARAALRFGVRLGLHCGYSSAGPTAVLLVTGMMDPRAMAAVTAVITVERLAPSGERVARMFGALGVAAGLLLVARAAGIG